MTEFINLLKPFGVSGYEDKLTDYIYNIAKDYADQIIKDCMGNIIAIKKGTDPKRKVMLCTTIDQKGVIGTVKDGDVLRFGSIGSLDASSLVGQVAESENGAVGIIYSDCSEDIKIKNLYMDIISGEGNTGDVFVLKDNVYTTEKAIVSSRISSRVGAYILLEVLQQIKGNKNDLHFVFATQGNLNYRGSKTATYTADPDVAITVGGVTACDTPSDKNSNIKSDNGVAIKIKDSSILAHPLVKNSLIDSAQKMGIKYQAEVSSDETSSGGVIHTSSGVVMTGGVSVPVRYKDSNSELCLIENINNTVKLILGSDLL